MHDDEPRFGHRVVAFLHVSEQVGTLVSRPTIRLVDERRIHGECIGTDDAPGWQLQTRVVEQRRQNRAGLGKHSKIRFGRGSNAGPKVLERAVRAGRVARRPLNVGAHKVTMTDDSALNGIAQDREYDAIVSPEPRRRNRCGSRLEVTQQLGRDNPNRRLGPPDADKAKTPSLAFVRNHDPDQIIVGPDGTKPVEGTGVVSIDGCSFPRIEQCRYEALPATRFSRVRQIDLGEESLPSVVLKAVLDAVPCDTARQKLLTSDDMVLRSDEHAEMAGRKHASTVCHEDAPVALEDRACGNSAT